MAASSEGKNPDKQLISLSPACHIASLPACFLGVAPLLLLPLLACMHAYSSVPGSLWARILEQVAMPSSREPFRPKDKPASLMPPALAGEFFTTAPPGKSSSSCPGVCVLSHFSPALPCTTLWTVARQAPLSMGFSRQEYWSGLPCPPPGNLPDPGIEPTSLTSPALRGEFFTTRTTWETEVLLKWDFSKPPQL